MDQQNKALEQFFFLAGGPRWLIRGPSHPSPRHRFEHVEVERIQSGDGTGVYRKRFLKTAAGADYSYWTEREIRFVSHFASVKTPHVARPKLVEYGDAAVKQVDTQDAGPSLDHWLKLRVSPANRPDRIGPLFADPAEVARLLCACINALHELHKDGIVHCDLKADNICLGFVGEPLGEDGLRLDYDRLSLIDFAFSVWPGVRTWELAQPLPIDPDAAAADYVSPFFKDVLREDRRQQPPAAWQRLNYNVDWYALAEMLRKMLKLLDSQRRDISGENPLESFLYGLADEWQTQYANGEIPATLPHQAEIARIQARFSHVEDWAQSGRFIPREAPSVQVAPPTALVLPAATPLAREQTPIHKPGGTPLEPKPPKTRQWVLASLVGVALVTGGGGYYVGMDALHGGWAKLQGFMPASDTDEMAKAEAFYLHKDYVQALPIYLKQADAGNGFAQFRLGSFYENGYGVQVNKEEAAKWYERSASSGDAFGQVGYAQAYEDGYVVPNNDNLPNQLKTKSLQNGLKDKAEALAKLGDPIAQTLIGKILHEEEDHILAVAWFNKAAEQGYAEAQKELGIMYKGDWKGVEKNLEQAKNLLRKAAEQNNAEAQVQLGHIYEKDDNSSQAEFWYKKAFDQGSPQAMNRLRSIYALNGEDYRTQGLVNYLKKSAHGNWEALFKLGRDIMINGSDGVENAVPTGLSLIEKSAERGYAEAQNRLGIIYEKGEGIPQNLDLAIDWYRKATANGNEQAQESLKRLGK